MDEEVQGVEEKLLEQFKDVFSNGEESLKTMNCKPSVIELTPASNLSDCLQQEI